VVAGTERVHTADLAWTKDVDNFSYNDS